MILPYHPSLCQWDPKRNDEATVCDGVYRGCGRRGEYEVRIGEGETICVCSSCFILPHFMRLEVEAIKRGQRRIPYQGKTLVWSGRGARE